MRKRKMNDRFKFRCWNKKINEMFIVYSFDKNFIQATPDIVVPSIRRFNTDDCILMQCTGLKDKNGTLIYEGDIVKENWHKYIIGYNRASFNISDIKTKKCFTISSLCNEKSEVIGNIYESEIPYGRSETSSDSEQMEQTGAKPRQRHSVSVEEFQDNKELLQ